MWPTSENQWRHIDLTLFPKNRTHKQVSITRSLLGNIDFVRINL